MQRVFRSTIVPGLTLALSISGGIGCGGDGSGDGEPGDAAFLTIKGDDDVFGQAGETRTLVVRYHDENDRPLAGTVQFRVDGEAAGAELSSSSRVTDSNGEATVELDFGREGEASFQVVAEAANADPAYWRASVGAPPLDVVGRYRLESQFSTPEGLPDGEAEELQAFMELTDDPYDPATWILDYIEDQLDDPFDDVLSVARQGFALDQELHGFIVENTPELVNGLIQVGDGLAEVSENLGLVSQLQLSSDDIESGSLAAHHRVTGAIFWLGGDRYDYTAQQLGLSWDKVGPVGAGVREQKKELQIERHQLYVPYGDLLVFALDNVVVPSIDPFSGSLTELTAELIDCEAIGEEIASEVELGSPALFEAACVSGVGVAAGYVEDEIAAIEADLAVSGDAELIDGNRDFEVEKLANGEWEGELVFGNGSLTLGRPDQKFVGTRMSGGEN